MAPNTQAIVALAGMKWWQLNPYSKGDLIVHMEILSLPMNSLYKQILVYRLVEIKALQ